MVPFENLFVYFLLKMRSYVTRTYEEISNHSFYFEKFTTLDNVFTFESIKTFHLKIRININKHKQRTIIKYRFDDNI